MHRRHPVATLAAALAPTPGSLLCTGRHASRESTAHRVARRGYQTREPLDRAADWWRREHRRGGLQRAGCAVATTEIIHVTDDTTKAELEEALVNLAQYAARQMHHPDCERWVTAHRRIDLLLVDWEQASA